LLTNIKPIMKCWLSYWLVSANDIWDGLPGCDWWLTSANDIRDGWPGCVWWLASLMESEMDTRVVFDD
jgi:hypothetical protein